MRGLLAYMLVVLCMALFFASALTGITVPY